MRNFRACLKKDFLLFLSGWKGIVAIILFPLIFILVLNMGIFETAEVRNFLKPFPIAVRDNDCTSASALLLTHLESVNLFSEIKILDDETTDEEAIEQGYVCVTVIPKDYFYSVYELKGSVSITLNGAFPREAELCKSMLLPLLDLIAETQLSYKAEHLLRIELDPEYSEDTDWTARMSRAVIGDVLELVDNVNRTDYTSSLVNQTESMVYSCVFTLLCFLIPLYTLKTIPEEFNLGILERFKVAGGSLISVILSKLISSTILYIAVSIPFLIISGGENALSAALTGLLIFISCLFILLPFALRIRRTSTFILVANTYLVASLVLGGCLYPIQLYPIWAQQASKFLISGQLFRGFIGGSIRIETVVIAAIAVVMGICASVIVIKSRRKFNAGH